MANATCARSVPVSEMGRGPDQMLPTLQARSDLARLRKVWRAKNAEPYRAARDRPDGARSCRAANCASGHGARFACYLACSWGAYATARCVPAPAVPCVRVKVRAPFVAHCVQSKFSMRGHGERPPTAAAACFVVVSGIGIGPAWACTPPKYLRSVMLHLRQGVAPGLPGPLYEALAGVIPSR